MADILITVGAVITMDPQRRVIGDGAVAIEADRIVAVGPRQEVEDAHSAGRVIQAQRKVIMPGLIDGHAHAGHALVKTIGHGAGATWSSTVDYIYAEGTDEEFWHAEALLASLDRLKNGTTCGVTYFGGGTMVMRVDEPVYADRHCEAVQQLGIREFLAVGPSNPPYPRQYARWDNGTSHTFMVDFDRYMPPTEEIIRRWHGEAGGRIHVSVMAPTQNPARYP